MMTVEDAVVNLLIAVRTVGYLHDDGEISWRELKDIELARRTLDGIVSDLHEEEGK